MRKLALYASAGLAFVALSSALGAVLVEAVPDVSVWQSKPFVSPEPVAQTHGEGTLLMQPLDGYNRQVTRLVEPGLASMVFADKDFAMELVQEARGNGERMCLADLGPQPPQYHGQRFWVFSC